MESDTNSEKTDKSPLLEHSVLVRNLERERLLETKAKNSWTQTKHIENIDVIIVTLFSGLQLPV